MKCVQCGADLAAGAQYCSKCGVSTSASGAYGVSAASQQQTMVTLDRALYAGFWRRFAALIVDAIVIYAVVFAIGAVLGGAGVSFNSPATGALLNLGSIVLNWLYYALQESSDAQATLGKRALGIKVVDENGEKIGFGRATGRHFGKILSSLILGVGFIMAGFTQRKQGLHDMIAGTLVVQRSVDAETMQRGGGAPVSGASVGIVIAVVVLAMIFILGILAAIAIPAYQDYTIRSQVTEGLTLAAPLKASITEWAGENQRWPQDAQEMDFDEATSGLYVETMEVRNGAIVITYGGAANNLIRGETLALTPDVDDAGEVTWLCGYQGDGPTTIKSKYLPSLCRAAASN